MYAVIFKAEINMLDETYVETAAHLRELAMNKYGCMGFSSVCEDGQEISVSYWPSQEAIQNWKQDATHLQAQAAGRSKWYKSYTVQIVEIAREYEYRAD